MREHELASPIAWLCRWTTKWISRGINAVRLAGLPAHRQRVRKSRRVLRELRRITGDAAAARVFGYLRKVEPLVCEEVVLSALEDAGAFVLRNRRYTGDGGIDGRCWLPGSGFGLHVVQVKRYDSAITPAHVSNLGDLVVRQRRAGGLFVHCGRTGPASYATLRGTALMLVSGDGLLRLLVDGALPHRRRASRGSVTRPPGHNDVQALERATRARRSDGPWRDAA